jgi:hypothetical protein
MFIDAIWHILESGMKFLGVSPPPAVSGTGNGTIYFNGTKFRVSENGGVYRDLVSSRDFTSADSTTTDGYVTVLSCSNPNGIDGSCTIKNTGVSNSLRYRVTFTDAFGITDSSTEQDITPVGQDYFYLSKANYGFAAMPYVSVTLEVKSTVAGNPTAYSVRASIDC